MLVVGVSGVAVWVNLWPGPKPAPRPARPAPPQRITEVPRPAAPTKPEPLPDYGPLRRQLADYLATRTARYSLYFKDLRSGAAFGIDEDRPIPAASSIKVPIVLYLNQLVAEGKASFDTRMAYDRDEHFEGGAGVLQMAAVDGDRFSLRVLANLAITISDNIATQMLLDYLGRDNVAAFMRSIGGRTVYPEGQNISTARDMAAYLEAVLDFAKEYPSLGNRLLDDMAHPIYHVGLPGELPDNVRVAHKEGEVEGVANDVGVVFSKRPFILAVLSDGQGDPLLGFPEIARMTRMVYDYQNALL
ncbi:MAG TPA: serine hydrolase [Firmicutes bacterium]|nr:serine hydrolase [Bacillota bacterium]